jgi:hypothetical protein
VAVRSRVPSICPRFPVLSFWSPQVAPIQGGCEKSDPFRSPGGQTAVMGRDDVSRSLGSNRAC